MTTAVHTASTPASTPDYAAIKQRQQATWAAGDYAVIGTTLQIVGENLCEAIDLCAGETVLDVAAGNGNACLAAARRYAEVTATDYVAKLLDQAKNRAEAEGLSITFETADAEDLPYEQQSFDVVLSTFGVMFTPNQAKSASEMLRVVRKGGRIGLANWTPESYIGQLFKIIGTHVPPPAGVQPPSLWGTQARLQELFAGHKIVATKRMFNFRYTSPAHWLEVFRTYYGPTNSAFAALNEPGQKALQADIMALLERMNVAGKRGLVVPSEYLEVVITKA